MEPKLNGTVQIGKKLHEAVAVLVPECERNRQMFFGKITNSRYVKLIVLSHLWKINYADYRLMSEIRCSAFPKIEFIIGNCPVCNLAVDEKLYPVRQSVDGGPVKCNVCGFEEELT